MKDDTITEYRFSLVSGKHWIIADCARRAGWGEIDKRGDSHPVYVVRSTRRGHEVIFQLLNHIATESVQVHL